MKGIEREILRLQRDAERESNATRRSWMFTLQATLSFIVFAFAPMLPKSEHIFGQLQVSDAFLYAMPAACLTLVSALLYRRQSPKNRAYEISDFIESTVGYGAVVAFIYGSGSMLSPLWIIGPFNAVFVAELKPFRITRNIFELSIPHALLSLVWLSQNQPGNAALCAAAGTLFIAILIFHSRLGQRTIRLQAKRNIARRDLRSALLDIERKKLEEELKAGLGHQLERIVLDFESQAGPDPIETDLLEQAKQTLAELNGITYASTNSTLSIEDISKQIESKCRVLEASTDVGIEFSKTGANAMLSGHQAHALLRISQELVRNAITHGQADVVTLALDVKTSTQLRVRDNGTSMSNDEWLHATGGIQNARKWLATLGGHISYTHCHPTGTEIRVDIPL